MKQPLVKRNALLGRAVQPVEEDMVGKEYWQAISRRLTPCLAIPS